MHVSGLATISLFFGGLAGGVYRAIINNGWVFSLFSARVLSILFSSLTTVDA